ncbi:hypothetical protein [Streptomyces phaeochromogenes]
MKQAPSVPNRVSRRRLLAAGGALEHWQPGLGLTDSRTLAHLPAPVARRLAFHHRVLLRVMATIRRRDIEAYRFNLFRFPAE